jgi:menaquinone-dependent protoporphyrinogen IX oxidase
MAGAIFFSGKYGSTAQYANWIGEATGLPVLNVNDSDADPSKYDFLILGSSVIIYKLTIRDWVKRNLASIENKPVILFTVSGAPSGPELDRWITESLPEKMASQMVRVALRGRLAPKEISWWDRLMLRIGAWKNDDLEARNEELNGFDFMDKSGIEPIERMVQAFQLAEATPPNHVNQSQVTPE